MGRGSCTENTEGLLPSPQIESNYRGIEVSHETTGSILDNISFLMKKRIREAQSLLRVVEVRDVGDDGPWTLEVGLDKGLQG